jgi:peptide/nickel transport system substrate-binding protein
MLAKVGIKAKLNAQTKAKHFKNITGTQTSFYLLGWTPASFDMHNVFFYNVATRPEHLKSGQAEPGQGTWNCGGYSNPAIDKLLREIAVELDLKKRQALIEEALKLHKADVPHLPLHQQRLAWGVKKSVELVQNPDDTFTMRWVKVK